MKNPFCWLGDRSAVWLELATFFRLSYNGIMQTNEFPLTKLLKLLKNIGRWIVTGLVAVYGCPSLVLAEDGRSGVSSSLGGSTPLNGVNINRLLGADRFYDAGFTGAQAIVAAIEGTVPDLSHVTMSNVTERVYGTAVPNTYQVAHHNHPTAVSHAMSGNHGPPPTNTVYHGHGIAYGAETWAGAIATSFQSNGDYNTDFASTASPYSTMMVTGVGGRTADVINSSWWFDTSFGNRLDTIGTDGLANRSGKLLVHIAGNAGSNVSTVRGFGAGYNAITVGALEFGNPLIPYMSVAGFSGRGPNDVAFALETNVWTASQGQTRAAVDIVAPGRNLTLARPTGGSNSYVSNLAGTSYAAPLVTGGAGLLIDAGKTLYGTSQAIDARVIKAVLLNSAEKLPDWDNGQSTSAGHIVTTQSLDYAQGAGRMNLSNAFDQYVNLADGGLATTADLPGVFPGVDAMVGSMGWDFAQVGIMSTNSYFLNQPLAGDSLFSATLAWFVDRNPGSLADFSGAGEEHFANLELDVFQFDNLIDRNRIRTVAQSISMFSVVEHLSFQIDAAGYYGIDVRFPSSHWNFVGSDSEIYGLAWNGVAVPEPHSLAMLVVALTGCCFRGGRRIGDD